MVSIILVKPQMGENIGAAARVMLNFGLTDLRLVSPRDGWPNKKAEEMAVGAIKTIKNAGIFENTPEAVSDLNYVFATTGRRRDMVKPETTPEKAAKFIEKNKKLKFGIIFGPERTGLENKDIVLADKIISVPVNPDFFSLNIAQAVAVICYEIYIKSLKNKKFPEKSKNSAVATKKQVADMLEHLTSELDKTNFLKVSEKRDKMLINIGNLFARADITSQEVQTLRGIINALANTGK